MTALDVKCFHGTSVAAARRITDGSLKQDDIMSHGSPHRWLGSGLYFFQDSHSSATAWARDVVMRNEQNGLGSVLIKGFRF